MTNDPGAWPSPAPSALVDQERSAAAPALLRLEKVVRTFDRGLVVALREVDLTIYPGEVIAVVGQSGSGKSSLMNILGGCESPSAGIVYWRERPLSRFSAWSGIRGREIGMVFQDFLLLPALTAIENVEMPLIARGRPAALRRRRAASLLEEVGLGARLHHLPSALSGGERQRVAIARAMANQPALLLADEPTGNLDSANAAAVLDLLFAVQRTHGMTLVVVTHDDALAARCERRIRMKDGQVVEDRRPEGRSGTGQSDTAPAAGGLG